MVLVFSFFGFFFSRLLLLTSSHDGLLELMWQSIRKTKFIIAPRVAHPSRFGTRTEGAVLAATAFLIGSGLLLLAVEDVRIDGERLEGVGVTPTIEVQAEAASAGSDDPQLSRAVAVLSRT
jgi:hypothetical protein